jgi:serine/threonine protein kinase
MLALGATGTVYQLNDFVVVKRAREGEDEESDHANEQKVFEFLEAHLPIPYLIRCIHRVHNNTFLELAPNGSLAMLLNKYQTRNKAVFSGSQVLAISQTPALENTGRWMGQLCRVAAGLERVGLAHGDIRPGNILFNSAWNLRLNDLDRAVKIGEDLAAVSEPFGRLLSKKDGKGAGTYGKAGARTETFAIGSVFYALLRGHDPYETEYWGRDHGCIMIEKFQNKEFPSLTDSPEDAIIHRCWYGQYQSVKELLAVFMDGAEQNEFAVEDEEWLMARKLECKQIAQSGILDKLERF